MLFAMLECKLVFFMIMQKFEWSITNRDTVEAEVAITLRAKYGIWCTIKEMDGDGQDKKTR
jgi:hypothetical protein